jgi:S-adenosylmethionine:tRNA ribosyltransferase-isomerase
MTQDLDRQLSSYDYFLPENRIAQNPVSPRDHSQLLVVRDREDHEHQHFYDLDRWLNPGDLLVLNNTKVIPARLYGQKPTGGQIEVLLLEEQGFNQWLALVKPGRKLQPGAIITFKSHDKSHDKSHASTVATDRDGSEILPPLTATIVRRDDDTGGRILQFTVGNQPETPLLSVIDAYGHMPLPPYITTSTSQPDQYQTVYAETPGSAAAPTAGLHFTPELFDRLAAKGIGWTFVTLHVGVGTFRPVESEDITAHEMHGEWIEVPIAVVNKIRETQANGGRVIAVGTTSVRSLEGAAAQSSGPLAPFCGKTNMFIYPGYEWRVVDGLITNFHLPKSSLMMLVSALIGRSRLLALYQAAIDGDYRFFSFGDAMLILPEATLSGKFTGIDPLGAIDSPMTGT